jgi:hypothetical protein
LGNCLLEHWQKCAKTELLPFLTILGTRMRAKPMAFLGLSGFLAKQVTFKIDRNGNIAGIFSRVNVKKHSQEMLEALDKLK